MKATRWLIDLGVAVATPLALIFGSVHLTLYDPGVYWSGFVKHDIARQTGLSQAELTAATQSFLDYFAGRGQLDVAIARNGQSRPLFNEKELRHMRDVRELFWLGDRVAFGAALFLAAVALGSLARRGGSPNELARRAVIGAAATLALAAVFFAASFVDFNWLFLQFHLISFSNDDWQLDPRYDYLLAMFPIGFWLDCAVRIATLTLAGAALIGGLGWWRWRSARPAAAVTS